jgi:integrase
MTTEVSPIRQRRRRRQVFTDAMVAALPRRTAAYFHPDPELPKHGVRVHPNRPAAYTVICRDPYGKQRWIKVGSVTQMNIADARELARDVIRRIEGGETAFEPPEPVADSVTAVAEQWLKRKVRKEKLRTADEQERIVKKYIIPNIGDRPFVEVRRKDITTLLDHIEDKHGPATADVVLSTLRMMALWQQTRDDDYEPPFTKNMRRTPKQDRKRQRMLTDDEIRAVWRHAGKAGAFGDFIKLLLLTAQRRAKVQTMKWSDINLRAGIWVIPTAPREKGNMGAGRLPKLALEIIKAQPRFVGNEFVFAGNHGAKMFHFARQKKEFDEECGVTGWRLHDLRRTARSLMSRAKVQSEHAEMVLGHSLGPIRETYDVHEYLEEKSHALHELAALLDRIINPPTDNVVSMHEASA